MKPASALASLLLLVTSTAAGLGIAEVAVRCFAAEPVYRSASGVFAGFQPSVSRGYFVRDPILGFAPGPGWTGTTGRRGFQNGAEYAAVKGPGIDIVLLGDSVLQSRLLEQAMKERLTDGAVRIWNAGIGGYNTLQEAYYLERRIRVVPHVIVLGFCLNDFLPSMTVVADGPSKTMTQNLFEPIGRVSPFWFRHSALYRMLKVRALLPNDTRGLWSAETGATNRTAVTEGLERIQRWAAEHDAMLVVAVYPYLTIDDDYLRAAHDTVLAVLAKLRIETIDLKTVYRDLGYDPEGLKMSPDDVVHPNAEGHRLAAAEIFKRLAEPLSRAAPRPLQRGADRHGLGRRRA